MTHRDAVTPSGNLQPQEGVHALTMFTIPSQAVKNVTEGKTPFRFLLSFKC